MSGNAELLSRVELIEQMIAKGRQSTEYHAWIPILWGTGYLVATGWMCFLPQPNLAWAVTMTVCGILTGLGSWLRGRGDRQMPETDIGHSIGSVWLATAFASVPIVVSAAAYSTPQAVPVVIFIVLGLANVASGKLLKWWPQTIIGLLWWACAIALANAPRAWMPGIFVFNALVCQIAFGLYLLSEEKKERRRG